MSTLNPLQQRSEKIPSQSAGQPMTTDKDALIDRFPMPRYFQVHFQHIHENTDAMQHELRHLRHQLAKLEEKLEQLTTLLLTRPYDN